MHKEKPIPLEPADLRHAHSILRRQAKASINEEQLFAVHERQVEILKKAIRATKAARRGEPRKQSAAAVPLSVSEIDFTKDPTPLPSEIWESSP